jgi:hypothetical protein
MSRDTRRDTGKRYRPSVGEGRTTRRFGHPQRLSELLKRSGWALRALTALLLLLSVGGVLLVATPFSVPLPNPDPPPFELSGDCPPPLVGAATGRGGVTGPLDEVEDGALLHDRRCQTVAQRRAVTGALLLVAGYLMAFAALEAGRTARRARRRRRRAR